MNIKVFAPQIFTLFKPRFWLDKIWSATRDGGYDRITSVRHACEAEIFSLPCSEEVCTLLANEFHVKCPCMQERQRRGNWFAREQSTFLPKVHRHPKKGKGEASTTPWLACSLFDFIRFRLWWPILLPFFQALLAKHGLPHHTSCDC
jgi:hypothetical protein